MRTLVRTINQTIETINQSIWSELCLLIGSQDYVKVRRLHCGAVGLSILVSFISVIIMYLAGQSLYQFWTGKLISLPQNVLLLFLIPIPFNAMWTTSSVVHVASNQHEQLATFSIIASIIMIISFLFASNLYGLEGAVLSLSILDLIMIPVVIKGSLKITQDTFKNFLFGIIKELSTSVKVILAQNILKRHSS